MRLSNFLRRDSAVSLTMFFRVYVQEVSVLSVRKIAHLAQDLPSFVRCGVHKLCMMSRCLMAEDAE